MSTDDAAASMVHALGGDQAVDVARRIRDYINEHQAHGGCHPVEVDIVELTDGTVQATITHQAGCPAAGEPTDQNQPRRIR